MSGSTIHLLLIIAFFVITVICAFRGYLRGAFQQVIRSAKMLVAAVISIFVSRIAWNKIDAFFDRCSIEDIQNWVSNNISGIDSSIVSNFDIETLRMIAAIPVALIVSPIAFASAFLTLNGIMTIVYHIVCGVAGLKRKPRTIVSRLIGLGIGVLHGALITGFVLLPVIGLSNYLSDAVATVNENGAQNKGTEKVNEIYYGYFADTAEGPIATALGACGMNKLYSTVATVNVGEQKVEMVTIIPDTAKIYADASCLAGADWKQLSPENKAVLQSMVETLKHSPQFKSISAGLVSGLSKTLKNGEFVNGMGESMGTVIKSMMDVFSNTSSETVGDDLQTILDVYFILSDSNVLLAFDQDSNEMLDALTAKDETGETNLNRVITIIKANDRTKPLITLMTKLSISIMSENLNIDGVNEEIYENVKTGLNETLQIKKESFETKEEYIEAVSDSIDTTLKDNGIELDSKIVETMAEYVSDNFSELEEITDDEINDIILSYYDAYINNNLEDLPELPGDLGDLGDIGDIGDLPIDIPTNP